MSQLTIESFPSFTEAEDLARFNNWIFEIIKPYLKRQVLELNSGQGILSDRLIEEGFITHLNANSDDNREFLRNKYRSSPLVEGIHKISLINPRMELKYLDFQEYFSTVIALSNIAEGSFFDRSFLQKPLRFLRPGGHFIVIGRCTTSYFPDSETEIGNLRRYNDATIKSMLINCQPLIARFFHWQGLCFIAVGRKSDRDQSSRSIL